MFKRQEVGEEWEKETEKWSARQWKDEMLDGREQWRKSVQAEGREEQIAQWHPEDKEIWDPESVTVLSTEKVRTPRVSRLHSKYTEFGKEGRLSK